MTVLKKYQVEFGALSVFFVFIIILLTFLFILQVMERRYVQPFEEFQYADTCCVGDVVGQWLGPDLGSRPRMEK